MWVMIPVILCVAFVLVRIVVPRAAQLIQRSSGRGLDKQTGSLQDAILRLTSTKKGELTVTDVVMATGLPFEKVEQALNKTLIVPPRDVVDHRTSNTPIGDTPVGETGIPRWDTSRINLFSRQMYST